MSGIESVIVRNEVSARARILLIEDDIKIAGETTNALEKRGFNVTHAATGSQGLTLATTGRFDVIVLDRMLPEIDGLSLLATFRNVGLATPVLILSALGAIDERVMGLRTGADDYLVKPFHFVELIARLDVLLRAKAPIVWDLQLSHGDLILDPGSPHIMRRGKTIELTQRERTLLEFLVRSAGEVVTQRMLLEGVWNHRNDATRNVIDIHIGRLRRKVTLDSTLPQIIHTARGVGWFFRPEEEL
ncbi:two-component system OmpR family response regulator [Paraburkholderia sp. UCT70]|uniref:response regulator transcription factor n=1 Tax=Paraburkholderia sp. UCT70 TaxID=2991068 RepID=UPI003D25FF7F